MDPSYMHPHTEVRQTPWGQRGVYATRPIARDELVSLWGGGVILDEATTDALPEAHQQYFIKVAHELYLGPETLEEMEDAEYFNHSCEPNCGMWGQIGLVAMRDIAAGEELTFDYAMVDDEDLEFDCRCGTPSCRGRVREEDAFRPDLVRRYRGYQAAWLERELGGTGGLREFLRRQEPALERVVGRVAAHLAGGGHLLVALGYGLPAAQGALLAELVRGRRVHGILATRQALATDLEQLAGPSSDALLERAEPLRLLREGELAGRYRMDPRDSWAMAAVRAALPLRVVGQPGPAAWPDEGEAVGLLQFGEFETADIEAPALHHTLSAADGLAVPLLLACLLGR